ncbi:nudix hydrolase 18, mitochondrial-like [Bidens hawaiensis]|uniref:nudix hydrolase 18, mitochondrial-like n=1 Tax=Bidens hawaiensis TaxID=980011 RepID=UPI00404B043E
MELKTMVSRRGRQLQRYNHGQRQVVGCIPYRIEGSKMGSDTNLEDALEVLVISAQRKGKGMLFPWESDESIVEAAHRESIEEAGVFGTVEGELGKWCFKSKGNDKI